MNQFKDLFLGKEKRSYTRATTCQKCVRAGGKHNDLDQVGFTARHLTYFEMLGNFSFGDYFKKDAICYAWEFLTKHVNISPEKLYVTIFKTDEDAYKIWNTSVGIPSEKIIRLGEKDNFWQMGDTGPCGPCTEIYFDLGANLGCKNPTCAPGCDCPRFIEIWNLVFMQYDRQQDGTLKPLEHTGVDTGMGLERLCMVLQDKETVFDTDCFMSIIKKIEKLTGLSYSSCDEPKKAAFRVLADHVRSTSLLIADGCSPSNEGRGYVLRKIIRRAALFAQKLSHDSTIFPKLSEEFINYLSQVYPELETSKKIIITVLECEIDRFTVNLTQGQNILRNYIDENRQDGKNIISGAQVFKLYDTYGFPPELTKLIAQEHSFTIDLTCFEQEMKQQQEQSGKKQKATEELPEIPADISTEFTGYETLETKSKVIWVYKNTSDNTTWVILDSCPFYAESGGQVGDKGAIIHAGNTLTLLDIKKIGTHKRFSIALKIKAPKKISLGDDITCKVDKETRLATVKNHTATHLLQAALVSLLGQQVKQAGSYVDTLVLRFDFTHHQALTHSQIEELETLVNQKIQEDIKTQIKFSSLQEAQAHGARAFFGEKYDPEQVRVVSIGDFSSELCGGTHAPSTGIIGCFKIISESALATGTRRITAVTGLNAVKLLQQDFNTIKKLSEEYKVSHEDVLCAILKREQTYQETLVLVKQLKKQLCMSNVPGWCSQILNIKNFPFLYLELEGTPNDELKLIAQEIEKKSPGFYFLVNKDLIDKNKFSFIGYVSNKCQLKPDLTKLSIELKKIGVKGGGSQTIIQGGGTGDSSQLCNLIKDWLEKL
jgi:alanyl-tRNA synthetase